MIVRLYGPPTQGQFGNSGLVKEWGNVSSITEIHDQCGYGVEFVSAHGVRTTVRPGMLALVIESS